MLRPTTTNLSDLLRRASSSSDTFTNYHDEPTNRNPLTFTPDDARATEDGGSGASTPPLWQQSSPERDPHSLYSSLSPASKSQAIARAQMELMEMVKNMPESCYDLSLRDLVEVNHRHGHQGAASKTSSELRGGQGKTGGMRRIGAQKNMVRSSSNSGGFLLKMVVPVSWGARKKKGRECCVNGSTSLRASPVSEKEWWSTKNGNGFVSSLTTESESLNSGSRKSSSSSSRSSSINDSSSCRRLEEISDCWSFIRMKKPNP